MQEGMQESHCGHESGKDWSASSLPPSEMCGGGLFCFVLRQGLAIAQADLKVP
jgi:hypothetical protein